MLRSALIVFFEQRAQVAPERLADEAIQRVAKAIGEGKEIGNPNTYTLAVARHLLREPQLGSRLGALARSNSSSGPGDSSGKESLSNPSSALEQLKTCLDQLSPEDLALLRQYYPRNTVRRKDHRQKLAFNLGISTRTLLGRIYHIQETLEDCLSNRR